jgi:acyl-CoA thioesterase I
MMGRFLFIVKALLIALTLIGSQAALGAPAILVFGDSLSAAYGIAQNEGWPALLQKRLNERRLDYTVVNASISGETTSGGASRIDAALEEHKPAIVIVELGANDGLRGLPVEQMRANLATIMRAAQKAGSRLLLVGMKLPPNYGPRYNADFERAFVDLSRQFKCPLVPFLLGGMENKRDLFLDDNLHPNAKAQPIILENVWKDLAPLPGAKR